MLQFCTCGAQLPADAVFCHKCGKPQKEIPAPEITSNPTITASHPILPPRETPLSFQNPAAIRVAFLMAAAATILSFILPFLNWVAGGFFAVLFYRRRTGSFLNVNAGLRLGWITGLITFVFSAIVFAINVLPHLRLAVQQQLTSVDPVMREQMMRLIDSAGGYAMLAFFILAVMFVLITFLTMAGGALGAKMVGRN